MRNQTFSMSCFGIAVCFAGLLPIDPGGKAGMQDDRVSTTIQEADTDPLEQLSDEGDTVKKLFASFRDESYSKNTFPELAWSDIPSLLKMARSDRELTCFPVNPLSSQFSERAREGIVSLWLIEGIRKEGKFASLNASCYSVDDEDGGTNYTRSIDNHAKLREAYVDWWDRVSMLEPAEARAIDPLADTGLYWR